MAIIFDMKQKISVICFSPTDKAKVVEGTSTAEKNYILTRILQQPDGSTSAQVALFLDGKERQACTEIPSGKWRKRGRISSVRPSLPGAMCGDRENTVMGNAYRSTSS